MSDNQAQVLGCYNSEGVLVPYVAPVQGFIFGDSIRDEDGFALAVLDQYGDWVSPSMLRVGFKCKMKVTARALVGASQAKE